MMLMSKKTQYKKRRLGNLDRHTGEDPLTYVQRAAARLNTHWLGWTYPFASLGRHTSIHYSVDVRRDIAQYISIGESVYLARDVNRSCESHAGVL